ncbi:MAG: penicillin-binding transpeptidase domain-containing protein [Lachnospiraceae bacterium]|nr:penicillin-binding transpeptidase domain-containing protein [Lachnospiraceae bacterium]
MFKKLKENLFNMVTSRLLLLFVVFTGMAVVLIYRLFYLQIVNGESYLNNFQLKIQKEKVIEGTRGNIYDRNGNLLAYNELAYSVTIEDVYESGSKKHEPLNQTLHKVIRMIEDNGDSVISEFNITLDNNEYTYTVEGKQLLRFLADVYGQTSIDTLKYSQETATAEEVIDYLCERYKIGEYQILEDGKKGAFLPRKGYTKKEALQMVTIRYEMSLYSYQKYIATTIATDVSPETVAVIMENVNDLDGVSIEEDTIRKYNYPYYFTHILGYTGKISQTELDELILKDDSYTMNDTVGKSGIEQVMELELQGEKGSETIYVDNLGKVIDTTGYVEPKAGNDLYLTIDKDLQVAAYNILEQKLAGILISKIRNVMNYDPASVSSAAKIIIPIDDVYFALINNNVIDTNHFTHDNASDTEKEVYQIYTNKEKEVLATLKEELQSRKTPYNKLSKEYKTYESYIVSMLINKGVLISSAIDREDKTYIAWTKEETISLNEYLTYAISKNWVDITKLEVDSQYSASSEVLGSIIDYILVHLQDNQEFSKKMYKYLISSQKIKGRQICLLLWEQDLISVEESRIVSLKNGSINPYNFMIEMIRDIQITPAQLALDPCTASCVVTDVNTGDVLALVSYPGYDLNKMANGVDAEYYAKINRDLSVPQWNAATQQLTAPGSTFKVVSSVAAVEEGAVSGLGETIRCSGVFDKLAPTIHRCWVYPSAHGNMNVSSAIANSCNCYFYEVGYRLSQDSSGYNSDYGLSRLKKYADLFGLTEKSGIEITESEPKFSDLYAVPSMIGQGTHNYTTVGLARYVTTIANSGTCYNLSLLEKLTDSKGNIIEDYKAEVRNQVTLDDSMWKAIHTGMRQVVETKAYYNDLAVNVAGKTGTAQQDKTRANHALFISYAPYENPEISVTIRIANGYDSGYAAQTARDVYKYYYGLAKEDDLLTGTAEVPEITGGTGD